jgi:signal transduction histidine kinase
MEMDLDPQLPAVPCLAGRFNQVILNLVVNAAQAIAELLGEGAQTKGVIRVATRNGKDHVEIRVSDTGAGIPAAIRNRVFDPFFTTKQVGKGTGQGLAIAHNIIVEQHGGAIAFESEEGKGTTFILTLPLSTTETPAEDKA